jgi:hypothetical protein
LIFKGNKEGAGTSPAPLESYLFFLAVLRRAVDFFAVVFLAVDFFAGFRFAGFFFAAAIVHPSFRAGWL